MATFGCAEERAPISRVQPDSLRKSFFVGEDYVNTADDPEFYYRGTVVDTGYGAQQDGLFTSTYAMPVSRIKWEITQTMLVARLAYERIADTDGKMGTTKGREGQVVAAFPITGQFDVRRSYNPVTGEEQNVLEENASDRPWNERDFIRVDWSRNMVTDSYDFDTLSMLGVIGGVKYEPMSYYVNDPSNPDAPVFGDGYFDVTQKVYATPGMIELPARFGGGSFPACFLDADIGGGTAPVANCNPHELKLRLSFRKVDDQEQDYEAQDWDGVRFQAFGAFTLNFNGRLGYTRPYGIVDDKTHRFIERYNIWQKSHYYDGAGQPVVCGTVETEAASLNDDDKNGTPDICEPVNAALGVVGSKCDVYAKKCTLPFQKRDDRPIVWYYLDGSNDPAQTTVGQSPNAAADGTFDSANGRADGLFEPTDWAAQEWDVAMRSARTTARLVECKSNSGDPAACEAQFPMWHGQMDDQEAAVRLAREVDVCRRANNAWTNGACDYVADSKASEWGITDPGVIAIAKQQSAVILCHSPVLDNDHPECKKPFEGKAGGKVRLGDLRFNVVNTINTPQTPSAWGIMVDATDPLNGHTVASSINIWNHVTDLASQGAVDIIRYINGELSTQDITDGKFVKDWVLANSGIAGGSKTMPAMSKDEVVKRLAGTAGATDAKSIEQLSQAFEQYTQGKLSDTTVAQTAKALRASTRDIRASADPKDSTSAQLLQQRMERARGTKFEAALINKPMLEASGLDSNLGASQLDNLALEFASPLRRNNQMAASRLRQARQNAMAERGACILEAAPEFSGMTGLARIMKEKFPIVDGESPQVRTERMRRYIARRYQYGVIIHEMGHSFGERHNFLSSYDAFNFRPQYWQLRTRNGTALAPCTDSFQHNENGEVMLGADGLPMTNDGANCVGPRYFDPITREEEDGLLWMWQQSSVMDYPGDITVDTLGLGAYDFAAARMFYGETTSVFANDGSRGSGINVNWTRDSDKDGYSDGFEQAMGSNPNDIASIPDRSKKDAIPQVIKQMLGDDPRFASTVDKDQDGVPDAIEELLGLDPTEQATKPYPLSKQSDPKQPDLEYASDPLNYRTVMPQVQNTSDILARMDQFGGILGLRTGDAHYSQHQTKFNLVKMGECQEIDPNVLRPSNWDDAVDGAFHPTLDGRVVAVDGKFKQCRQLGVDYQNWSSLAPAASESDAQTVVGDNPPAIDPQGRVRFPYPFATDNWADTGNASVFRHDQGADVYEQFMFLMGSQENRHIFDHYRRNRTTFAIRPAMGRDFDRYTGKIMNVVKGLGLYRNLYTTDYIGGVWGFAAGSFLADNVIAASLAMDHFSRQLTRPQDGEHYFYNGNPFGLNDKEPALFRSSEDTFINGPQTFDNESVTYAALEAATTPEQKEKALAALKLAHKNSPVRITIPNGSSGYKVDNGLPSAFLAVSFGGRPLNNSLDRTKGDYSSSYQLSVGSYYEKINAVMAMTESQDNFISASRTDFVDGRYRATSVADVFPEGFRRLIGAALAEDGEALGPRVGAKASALPKTTYLTAAQQANLVALGGKEVADIMAQEKDVCDPSKPESYKGGCVLGEDGNPYPAQPIAWTSWWPVEGPRSCWTINGSQVCAKVATENEKGEEVGNGQIDPGPFAQKVPTSSLAIDPQIGWEVQKYIIAWTYYYLPENNRTDWFDMMRIYRSYDIPDVQGAVVKWRDPFTGTLYMARSYGKEEINGKMVEKGIAARVLEHCNELTKLAFFTDGVDETTGEITLALDDNGQPRTRVLTLDEAGNETEVPAVDRLKRYKSIPDFMWQASEAYGLTEGYSPKGIY